MDVETVCRAVGEQHVADGHTAFCQRQQTISDMLADRALLGRGVRRVIYGSKVALGQAGFSPR